MCFPALRHLHVLKCGYLPQSLAEQQRIKQQRLIADGIWLCFELSWEFFILSIRPTMPRKPSAVYLKVFGQHGPIWANCELTSRLSLDSMSASQSSQPWMIPAMSFIQQQAQQKQALGMTPTDLQCIWGHVCCLNTLTQKPIGMQKNAMFWWFHQPSLTSLKPRCAKAAAAFGSCNFTKFSWKSTCQRSQKCTSQQKDKSESFWPSLRT